MRDKIFKIGQGIVKYIAIIFLLYFALTSIFTYIYDAKWMEMYVDSHSIFANIIGVISFLIIYMALLWLRDKYPLTNKKWERIYAIILFSIFILTLIQFPMPRADLANIMKAVFEMNEGNYTYLDDTYFKVWPHMYFMVALFKVFGPVPFVYYGFNFILLLIMFNTLMRTTNSNKYIASALVLCLPIIQYTCVYYGEFMAIFAITMSICYMKNILTGAKKGDYIGLAIVSFLGLLFKQNYIIFIIGEILTIILFLIKKNDKRILMSLVIIIFATLLVSPFQHAFTKLMIDREYTSQDNLTWIAMGMQESGEEYYGAQINGGYNGFNSKVVYYNNYDKELIRNDSVKSIKESINRFKDNGLGYTLGFYHDKLSKQWTSPDWSINHYLKMTRSKNIEIQAEERIELGENFKTEEYDWGKFVANYDQIIDVFNKGMMITIYAASLYLLIKKKSGEYSFGEIALLALFIGNVLFSIIWEAKPRYCIYGYYALMVFVFTQFNILLKNKIIKS